MKCFLFGPGLDLDKTLPWSGSVLLWITAKESTLPENDDFKQSEDGSNKGVRMANSKIEFYAIQIRETSGESDGANHSKGQQRRLKYMSFSIRNP